MGPYTYIDDYILPKYNHYVLREFIVNNGAYKGLRFGQLLPGMNRNKLSAFRTY